jgi:NAD(P)-dependent dehydrogenase (short-subunit alcohol dehydrogenase family)
MHSPVVMITGAGRGIGRACALRFARAGYRQVLCSRTAAELAETARLAGGEAVCRVVDVSDSRQVAVSIDSIDMQFGRLDAVVHCAGYAPLLSIEQTRDEIWRQVIDTNLSAAMYLARSAWPIFRRQQAGVLVNISSLAARDPLPGFSAYGAAKAGLNLLGHSLAREGAASGIRVHTIAPGGVETAMLRAIVSAEALPPEKTLSPEDVAAVVLGCVSGEMRYSSGEVIYLQKSLAS